MSWESLPVELHITIFTILLEDYNRENLSAFAFTTVSRKWQDFFEPIFFRRLDQKDTDFSYIRHLWFRLKLAPYTCYYCQTREPNDIIHQNNARFTRAVCKLLDILARGNHTPYYQGITLQLSAHSSSDYRHKYRDFRMGDKYPYITKDLVDKGEFHRKHRDLSIKYVQDTHPEVVSHQYMAYQPPEMDRFRSTEPLRFDFRKPLFRWSGVVPGSVDTQQVLPKVNIVEALVIRRQFYRNISSDALIKLLRESFLSLETFRDERWLGSNYFNKILCSPENVIDALPPKLQRLHIYQDADSDFSLPRVHSIAGAQSMRKFATLSELKELSIAPDTDGWGFLLDFLPIVRRPLDTLPVFKLRRLALDCATLREPEVSFERLVLVRTLRAAAAAASRMPRLETMELWRATPSSATLFRYSTKNLESKITWRINWKHARGDQLWQGKLRKD
ncbi:hypothetical protein CEP52_014319 [Fusarium oligoseptatum]|uniref:DUF6546 domain-containing protein n=1 Tax=Fusarium oligoseptatum TaxID=2604345 RepID=A0A428SN75_9HYPO|nr:hypothetical protein CEP52_014319 [Fusarium oligoseptatum]